MIRRKESDDIKENYKTKKYNFQGQPSRKKYCFNLDHKWLKLFFMPREPDFYKKLYDTKFRVIKHTTIKKFGLTIGNSRMNQKFRFRTEASLMNINKRDLIVVV